MKTIKRKSLLYKTQVEYADYTINHIIGCSHGCLYPCYAMQMSKRFGRIASYDEWLKPRIIPNALELLDKEIPRLKHKINSVHLCFMSDPFMMGHPEVTDLSLEIIDKLHKNAIKTTTLTKGLYPYKLSQIKNTINEYGITLVSLDEEHRKNFEPNSSSYLERINSLNELHDLGFKTWVSMEPYPTPNIFTQDLLLILEKISFVDKIVFGRLNYNSKISKYKDNQTFYNNCCDQLIRFCEDNDIEYYIKKGTYRP
ncbi:MAG: radical SAM protein [Nitrospirae bacterium]|nr:radical SAM protein [Nitrospirota bacterium]